MNYMTIENLNVVFYTCIFLVPGYIIKSILSKIIPTQKQNDQKYFFSCLLYSMVNAAVFSGFYQLINTFKSSADLEYWILHVVISVLGAVCIGFVLAYLHRKDVLNKILPRDELNTFSSIPSAWDYCFSKQESHYVIVTLNDGSIIYGLYSVNSFSSSESDERDLFVEKVYKRSLCGKWILDEKCNGILISKNAIRTIEFC